MDDLVVFLRARYAEDEQVARAAIDATGSVPEAGRWRYAEGLADEGGRYWVITTAGPVDGSVVEVVGSGMSGGGVHEEALSAHIVRHNPARVLAEVEAKLGIVEDCENIIGGWNGESVKDFAMDMLRLLAAPYREHPDYKPEWAPSA